MARCPECGGSVGPLDYAGLRPGVVRCQWCNARVELPRGARLVRDAVLVVSGGAGVTGGIVRWRETGDPLWLVLGAAAVVAGVLAGLLVEALARPVTRAGRSVSPMSPQGWDDQATGDAPAAPAEERDGVRR